MLPLREMVENMGLTSKSMMPKRGRKSHFTPAEKVALMFFEDVHADWRTESDGAVERECALPDILRQLYQYRASADEQ